MLLVRCLKVFVGWVALLAPACALADSACVTTPIELQSAMLQWLVMDSGTMTIKVVKGAYLLAPTGSFDAANEANLNILGGYRPGTGCSERDVDPGNTVLDGANSTNVQFWIGARGDVTLEGLTFKGLRNGFLLEHDMHADATGHAFSVRYNIFRDFQVQVEATDGLPIGAGVNVDGGYFNQKDTGAFVSIKNNLIYNIQMDGGQRAVWLTTAFNGLLTVACNTIGFNGAPASIGARYAQFVPELVNNVIWRGAGAALAFDLDQVGPDARYNVLGPVQGVLSNDVANIYADPQWGANYHLAAGSPAINSGGSATLVSGGFPSHDLDGNARIVGSAIDRGAFESPYDDSADFVVNKSFDASHATNPSVNCNAGSDTCTLREAIVRANAAAGASTIRFTLACPTVLLLASPLPDITGNTTIDGYTGNLAASRNNSATQFNASLCVFLNGNGSVARALHTAAGGKLALTGLGFAGFNSEAVLLDAGSGHTIGGNQFGAVPFTGENATGVRVAGAAGHVVIGGYDSDLARNLFANHSDIAVVLSGSAGNNVVANNFFGVLPDSVAAAPDKVGVQVLDSPNNAVAYNAIASSTQNGIWLCGATNTIVADNLVGYAADGKTQRPTGSFGIFVDCGASDNVIGAGANSTSGGNAVLSTGGAPIYVSNTGASGNRILANAPLDGANDAPAIDLSLPGATPNDAGDADIGANHLQNFPVIENVFRTATAEWIEWSLDSTPGSDFRLDFYRDICCTQGPGNPPRGNVGIWLTRAGSGDTDAGGHAHGWVRLAKFSTFLNWTVAATATSLPGDTSELGPYTAESSDMIFRDDVELH